MTFAGKQEPLSYSVFLVRVSTAAMRHHDQKQLGEQRVYLAYIFLSLKEDRVGTQTGWEP